MRAALAPCLIALAAVTACREGAETRRADSSAVAPQVVAATATEYAIALPDTIPAGWTTFRFANGGTAVHYGHIVRLDPGHTVEEMAAAYLEAIRTSGPRPTWVKRFGGPGGAGPGGSASVTQELEPGSYVWICPVEDEEGHPHFAKGEVKSFVVRASPGQASLDAGAPAADGVIRLVNHSFAIPTPLGAGQRTIRVENAGTEPHDVGILKLAPGRTIEDVRRFLNPERARRSDAADPPPPLESIGAPVGGVAAMKPGMSAYMEATLTPGDYVLFCMVTAPDGRSHIEHGMLQALRID